MTQPLYPARTRVEGDITPSRERSYDIGCIDVALDSGADVTLLPQAAVDQLGISAGPGEGYELMGFDGSVSVARAVWLDLLFLRRSFKGRFLLIDQEWGLLGRDTLNHVSLLFDGPRLSWSEQVPSER